MSHKNMLKKTLRNLTTGHAPKSYEHWLELFMLQLVALIDLRIEHALQKENPEPRPEVSSTRSAVDGGDVPRVGERRS